MWEKHFVNCDIEAMENAGVLSDITHPFLNPAKDIMWESTHSKTLKRFQFKMLNAWELCFYLLWFKRLEASFWATEIQSDRNLQIFIAVHLIKFTFTSCQFEMLNNWYFSIETSRFGCIGGSLLPTYSFLKYSE